MEQSTLSRKETGARSNTSRDTTLRPNTPLHPLLKLQQAVGNRAVQRMIRSVSVRAAQEVDGARPFAAAHIAESVGDASRQRLQQPRTNVRHAIQRSPDSNADREAAIKEYEAYE